MTDYQIPASVVEVAQKAGLEAQLEVAHGSGMTEAEGRFYAMEKAIRRAFDELGMEPEDAPKGIEPFASANVYRLVSRWMPVNDVVEKP